ncbi:hypothetical protein TNCV_2172281 [Trichonephila clavipes]|nr:hypothetical protein TNCV_2172281 [Trichonephila clavipes]
MKTSALDFVPLIQIRGANLKAELLGRLIITKIVYLWMLWMTMRPVFRDLANPELQKSVYMENLGGRTGKILLPSSVALKSKNQEINRLQLAVKLPWATFFESVDISSLDQSSLKKIRCFFLLYVQSQ